MAITYTWSITGLKKAPQLNGLTDVVTTVEYAYTGVDENGNSASFHGSVELPEPSEDGFVSIESLTEEEVLAWAKDAAATQYMKQNIKAKIANNISPKNIQVDALPWI